MMEKVWRWLVLFAASVAGQVLFRTLNRLEIRGGVPKCILEPIIFYANHRSFADPFLILFGCLIRPQDMLLGRSPAVWSVAYAGLFSGWRRLAVKPCRIILRDNPWHLNELEETVEEMRTVISRGENLLIFPEGRRHLEKNHADLAPFKRGLAWLVKHHKAQVIPVALKDTTELLPIGSFLPRLGKRVQVIFGDPVPSTAWNGKGIPEITAELEKRLKELLRAAC